MLKKAGLLTVGITAGLLAVAPIASAGEYESDKSDKDSSHDKDHDGDHGKKKHHDNWDDDEHDGGQHGTGNISCDNEGGGVDNDVENSGTGAVGQITGPALSGNTGNLASCNSFLNNNLNDISVDILSVSETNA